MATSRQAVRVFDAGWQRLAARRAPVAAEAFRRRIGLVAQQVAHVAGEVPAAGGNKGERAHRRRVAATGYPSLYFFM
jgi:hypothetical protein